MTLRDEILARSDCEAAVAARDCQAIADTISVGRTQYKPTMITERGVRAALPITNASQFLKLLKEASESAGTPAWLSTVLTTIGVPTEDHSDYAEAVASAYGWLRQEAGIDISNAATRGMLDIIAASNPTKYGLAVTLIKSLAQQPVPVTARDVAVALFNDDGSAK